MPTIYVVMRVACEHALPSGLPVGVYSTQEEAERDAESFLSYDMHPGNLRIYEYTVDAGWDADGGLDAKLVKVVK